MTEPRHDTRAFGLLARDLTANGKGFRFCARGRSMWPTIQDGDILHVEPLRKSPRIGEIVLFMNEGQFKAHRIVGGAGSYFVTRGDAGMEADGLVRTEEIIGRVVARRSPNPGRVITLAGVLPRISYFAAELKRSVRAALISRVCILVTAVVVTTTFLQFQAHAQSGGVALDNVNTQAFTVGGSGNTCTATGVTGQFNCQFAHTDNFGGANSNTLLIVGVSMNVVGNADSSVLAMACNGIAMSQGPNNNPGNNLRASIFYLMNPPLGACTIQATVRKSGASGNPLGVVMGAMSLYRVNTAGSITGAQSSGTGTTASLSFSTTGTNDGLVEVLAIVSGNTVTPNTNTTSPLVFETQQWSTTSGATGQDVEGFASSSGGTGANVTMQETISASLNWTMVAVDIPAQFPTVVKIQSFNAAWGRQGALLSWKTGGEVHNLGFNVYRDVAGTKTRLNPSLIAGSALLMRDTVQQHGAKSYGWIDSSPSSGAVYWLEDVDLDGTRTMHGPVSLESYAAAVPRLPISPSIGALARARSQISATLPVPPNPASHVLERTARPKAVTSFTQNVGFQLAAKPGIKILVDHEGWYRITQPQLVSAGLNPNASSNLLHLYAEGVEQPIRVAGGGGTFGPKSAIEFYGTAIDTPYSGQRVYWLTEQGGPGLRIGEVSPNGTAASQPPSFTQTLELKPKTTYFAALLREDTDNFFGPLVSPTPDVETINVTDLAGGEAQLTISLQGVTTGQQHDVTVMLNGSTLGDVTFADQQAGSAEFAVPAGILLNGPNSITLTAQQGANDLSLVDTITLSFAHTYTAESNLLKFTAGAGQSIAISGFTQPPTRLVDITNPLRPMEIRFSFSTQNGLYTLESAVPWTTGGEHTLLALSDLQVATPVSVVPHAPTRLHVPQPGAEFVVITAPQFKSQFQPLAALHMASGNPAAVINVSDIYDEFNFGEPSPFAVKSFLKTATTTWTAKPHYLVLGGDASVDPRNYLGFGFFDFVPTKIIATSQLKTASDDWFSDFNNTGFATIATGRMAARTPSDARLMVSKTVAYSTGTAGSWNTQALIVADADDPGTSFTQAAQSVQGLLPSTLNATDVFAGNLGTSTANQDILAGINSGQLLVNYNGHGSVQVWGGGGLFDDTMAASLTNGNKLPFFVIMNCLNGFFHDVYTQSLAESLMLAPNGGAVAVWASSGLTNAGPQFQMNDRLMQILFSHPAPALGDAVLAAKSGISDIDVRRTFIFFGDPALRLRTPGSSGEALGSSRLQTTISTDEKSEH